VLVFNKCDRIPDDHAGFLCRRYHAIGISAVQPQTLHPLIRHLERALERVRANAGAVPTQQSSEIAALASRA
jgi:GTP-binding protein HflX